MDFLQIYAYYQLLGVQVESLEKFPRFLPSQNNFVMHLLVQRGILSLSKPADHQSETKSGGRGMEEQAAETEQGDVE